MKQACFLLLFFITIFSGCKNAEEPPKLPADTIIVHNKNIMNQGLKNAYADIDLSPMDMCYFPPNYPQLNMPHGSTQPPVLRLIYSRPHLQGRKLFHDILKYNEPWRLGANEATELQVYQPVSVDGRKLNKGRYTLYAIPQEGNWIIAFNKAIDVWGLKQDSTKDLFRVTIPVTHNNPSLEYFTMVFEKTKTGGDLLMGWGDVIAKLPFNL